MSSHYTYTDICSKCVVTYNSVPRRECANNVYFYSWKFWENEKKLINTFNERRHIRNKE